MQKMMAWSRGLHLYKSLIPIISQLKNPQNLRSYCTTDTTVINVQNATENNANNIGTTTNKEKKKKKKETLYSKISPLGNPRINVTTVLDQWVQKGNKVRFAELQRIIHDLRMRSRFSQALQVSEWTKRQNIFTFSPTEHAVQLNLIGKVHGFLTAESYFNSLSEQDKTEKTYGALLHCYVRQRQVDKSLFHLQNMKEKGLKLSSVAYNDIMSLYTNIGQHEKVPNVLSQMEEDGVSPDNLSYRICINSYGQRSDIESMEKIYHKMACQPSFTVDWNTYAVVANFYIKAGLKDKATHFLKRAEERLDIKTSTGYNHLISLHTNLGNKAHVFRLWNLENNTCKRCVNMDYINMLKCLVKLGELEEAEKLLKEWESSGNCYDFRLPYIVIDGYTEQGLYEKAEAMLEDLMDKGKAPKPDCWGKVAAGFLDRSQMENAVECMKVALSLCGESKRWKPNQNVITRLIDFVSEKGSREDADALSAAFLAVNPEN